MFGEQNSYKYNSQLMARISKFSEMVQRVAILVLFAITAFTSVQSFAIYQDGTQSTSFSADIAESMIKTLENSNDLENNRFAEYFLTTMAAVFPAPDAALLKFESTVDSVVNNSTKRLQNLTDNLAKEAHTAVQQANVTLYQQSMSLLYEVGMLEEGSKAIGIDPAPCTQAQDDTIQKLPSHYSDKLQECEGGKLKLAESRINSAIQNVKIVLNETQRFRNDLELCEKQNGVRVKLCKARIGTEIAKATEYFSEEIERIVTHNMQLISSLYSEVQICAVTINTEFLNQGKQIVDDIEKCIDGEINF